MAVRVMPFYCAHDLRHLRRSCPEKIVNVFQRIRLRFFRGCGLASAVISVASVLIDLVRRVIEGRGDVAWLLRSIGESTIGTGLMAGRNYGTSIRSIALPCRP